MAAHSSATDFLREASSVRRQHPDRWWHAPCVLRPKSENHNASTHPAESRTDRHPRPPRTGTSTVHDHAEIRPLRRPCAARSGSQCLRDAQSRADGVRHTVRDGCRGQRPAADAARLHHLARRPDLDADPAPRPALPRRYPGPRPRRRGQHPTLADQRRIRPGARRRDRRTVRPIRHADKNPPEAPLPPAARRSGPSDQHHGSHHAGASGENRHRCPPDRDRRQRPLPLSARRTRPRRAQRLCEIRALRPAPARPARFLCRPPPGLFRPRRMAHHPRSGHPDRRPDRRGGGLGRTAPDGLGPLITHQNQPEDRGRGNQGPDRLPALQPVVPAIRQSLDPPSCAESRESEGVHGGSRRRQRHLRRPLRHLHPRNGDGEQRRHGGAERPP